MEVRRGCEEGREGGGRMRWREGGNKTLFCSRSFVQKNHLFLSPSSRTKRGDLM